MLVMLALLASAPTQATSEPASALEGTWRVEVPFAVSASAPASNVETTVVPWIGVRVGRLLALEGPGLVDGSPMMWGFDVAPFLTTVRDGTPEVASARTLGFIEGRGLFAPGRVASTFSAFVPYAFLGASAGGGLVEVKAFEQSRVRPLFTWGTRVGAGAEVQVHALTLRLDLGAGLRDLRFELTSALAFGVAL